MAYKRNSIEVPELEILLAGKKKKYVRYPQWKPNGWGCVRKVFLWCQII